MVLADKKLIFFTEAHPVLWFGLLVRLVVIAQGCFSCCRAVLTQSQAFSAPHATLPVRRLGVSQELGRDTSRTADPRWLGDVPCHMVPCSAVLGQWRRKGGHWE